MRVQGVRFVLALALFCARAASAAIPLPSNTWVGVPLPTPSNHGSACDGGACKHVRVAYNTMNKRTYWLGGDHESGPNHAQSGSNEMWSYSVSTGTWRIETPYCLQSGQYQPSHPDEVGFAYDSRRNQFWHYPGYQYQPNPGECPSIQVYHKPMVYDVTTGLWSDPNLPYDAWLVRASVYDPVLDRTISFEYDGSSYFEHNLGTGVMRRVSTVIPPGEDGGTAQLAYGKALDLNGRKLYAVDTFRGKLYRLNLDTNEFKFMCTTPVSNTSSDQLLFWDPVYKVILWPMRDYTLADGSVAQIRMFIWHESTNAWTEMPIAPPVNMQGTPLVDGSGNPVQVHGRQGVFDPDERVAVIAGTDATNYVPYLFLFRYAEGPPDTVPPSPPSDLHPR